MGGGTPSPYTTSLWYVEVHKVCSGGFSKSARNIYEWDYYGVNHLLYHSRNGWNQIRWFECAHRLEFIHKRGSNTFFWHLFFINYIYYSFGRNLSNKIPVSQCVPVITNLNSQNLDYINSRVALLCFVFWYSLNKRTIYY